MGLELKWNDKASIKQHRVAEGFLTSLAQITKAVRKSSEETQFQSSPDLDRRIATLYSQIFLFLGEFMDLYIAKGMCRQLDSHTEDFLSYFRNLIQSIKSSARAVSADDVNVQPRESKYKLPWQFVAVNEARLKQVGQEGPERQNAAQSVFVLQQIWDARRHIDMKRELIAERESILADLISSLRAHLPIPGETVPDEGVLMAERMESTPDGHSNGMVSRVLKKKLICSQASPDLVSSPIRSNARRRLTRLSLQFQSRDLQDWFSNDDQIYDFDPHVRLSVDPSVAMALHDWTRGLRSQTLAISGDQPVALPDATTQLCACYVSLARQQHIPIISHFCLVRRYTTGDRATRAERGLIALAYSLIRQLIELAPPMFNCDSEYDLSADRFRRLDGTMASWKDALSILDILLSFAPPILFCAIDGLDLLEVPSTEDCLRSLVQVLVSHTARRVAPPSDLIPQETLLKVLFTTAARSSPLQSVLDSTQLRHTDSLRVVSPAMGVPFPPDSDTAMMDL
jgi:hypothetical protein